MLRVILVSVMMVLAMSSSCCALEKIELGIIGLFPKSDPESKLAAEMAVQDINNDLSMLPMVTFFLTPIEAYSNGPLTLKGALHLLFSDKLQVAILGPRSPAAITYVAEAAAFYNVMQFSYSVPSLEVDSSKYRYLFNTYRSIRGVALAYYAMFKYFNWTTGTILSERSFHKTSTYLKDLGKRDGYYYRSMSVSHPPMMSHAMEQIQKETRSLFTVFADANLTAVLLCAATKYNLYGSQYVWIIPYFGEKNWWQDVEVHASRFGLNCTEDDVLSSLNNAFAVKVPNFDQSDRISISKQTGKQFHSRFLKSYGKAASNAYYSYCYDSMWAFAVAFRKALSRIPYKNLFKNTTAQTYYDTQQFIPLVKELKNQLSNLKFQGVTGKFNMQNKYRISDFYYIQYQDIGQDYNQSVVVGQFTASNSSATFNHSALSWPDGHAPAVIIPHAIIAIQISSSAFATIASLCILGICLALICLGFNIVKRKHRFIKMSSPNINNLLTIGCIICYVAIILFGVDTNFMASVNLPIIYAMRVWFLCIGFTIAFGSLFVKTWRVYRIFNNKTGRKIIIRDGSLIRAVMQLVLIDVAILLIWLLVDPYKLKQQSSFVYEPITIAGTSYRGKEIIQYTCTSTHSILWLAVIYSYKGLLMLFGAYLAFATRRVAIEALNDSRYIAVCIYQVTILSMISVAISFITSTNVDLSYMLFSGMSLLCVTSVLCIVFIPKMMRLKVAPDEKLFTNTMQSKLIHARNADLRSQTSENTILPLEENTPNFSDDQKDKLIEDLKKQLQKLMAENCELKAARR